MAIVETKQLTRKFGDATVVDALNITLEKGDIFALLGPNGAGKTTVIKMLTLPSYRLLRVRPLSMDLMLLRNPTK